MHQTPALKFYELTITDEAMGEQGFEQRNILQGPVFLSNRFVAAPVSLDLMFSYG